MTVSKKPQKNRLIKNIVIVGTAVLVIFFGLLWLAIYVRDRHGKLVFTAGDMRDLAISCERYQEEFGHLPPAGDTSEFIASLQAEGYWDPDFRHLFWNEKEELCDLWGNPLILTKNASVLEIRSVGFDGKQNTSDDIVERVKISSEE